MTKRKPTGPVPHGTNNGYSNYGCRCEPCRAASSAYRTARYTLDPDVFRERSRRWAAENAERYSAIQRASRQRNAEANRAGRRTYYLANRERRIAAAVAWAQQNPDRRKQISSAYKRRHPDRDRAHVELRRARKAAADTREITVGDWLRLCQRYDDRCAYCREPAVLTQDHVIPISRGGRHSIGNLLPACGPCNSSKGTKLLVEWRPPV